MNKLRLKQILEAMLMNDAPMHVFGSSLLDSIRKGEKILQEDEIEEFRQEHEAMRNAYEKIDISKLDKETGKSIIEKCQPLIKEFYDQYFILFDNYIKNNFQAQEVPQRLFKIWNKVGKLSSRYRRKLKEALILYDKAWKVRYFNHNFERRSSGLLMENPQRSIQKNLSLF